MLPETEQSRQLDGTEVKGVVEGLMAATDSVRPLIMCGAIAEGGIVSWRDGAAEAVDGILKTFRAEQVDPRSGPVGIPGVDQAEEVVSAAEVEPVHEPGTELESVPPVPPDEGVDPLVFTPLDRLLIRSIVDGLQGQIGALRPDEIEDVVQEILDLNSSRIISRFHEGFLDSLQGRAITESRRGTNEDRECWYLVGYFMAKLRVMDGVEVFRLFEELPVAARRLLVGNDARPPSRELLPHLIRAAGEIGDVRFVIQAIGGRPKADMQLFWSVLRWVETDLMASDLENVLAVGKAMEEWLMTAGFDPGEQSIGVLLCRKTRITAHRLRGEFAAVEHHFNLVAENPPPSSSVQLASIPGSLAMARLGIRDAADIGRNLSQDHAALSQRIRTHLPAEELDSVWRHWPPTAVLYAMPAVLGKASDPVEAISVLESTVESMTVGESSVWRDSGLLDLARICLGILELESGDESSSGRAIARVIDALKAGSSVDQVLMVKLLEAAVMSNASETLRLATALLERTPREVLVNVDNEELCRRSEKYRKGVKHRLELGDLGITPLERMNILIRIGKGSMRADVPDTESARWALDEVAAMAQEDSEIAEQYASKLERDDFWKGVLSEEEADTLCLQLLDRIGAVGRFQGILLRRMNAAVSDSKWNLARDLLDQWDEKKLDDSVVRSIRERIEVLEQEAQLARRDPSAEEKHLYRDLTVLFVGGNEMQRQYEESLELDFKKKFPGLELSFHFPGWSANWGPKAARVESELENANAMVLMPMIRTMFGRRVRADAGRHEVPWIACTGRGRASLERALLEGVRVAVEQRRKRSSSDSADTI
ncbi:MAG: DUF2325 domain-containing protein [Phycisphaera sp.]|nr:DUF2325 domain-containing protein [Phycisphaera sp.]